MPAIRLMDQGGPTALMGKELVQVVVPFKDDFGVSMRP